MTPALRAAADAYKAHVPTCVVCRAGEARLREGYTPIQARPGGCDSMQVIFNTIRRAQTDSVGSSALSQDPSRVTREHGRGSTGAPRVLTVDQAVSDAGRHRRPGQACAGYRCSRPTTGSDAVCRFHAGLQDDGEMPAVWDTPDAGRDSREER
jgi:hypothetical protein